MPFAAYSSLCCWDSVWAGVFERSALSSACKTISMASCHCSHYPLSDIVSSLSLSWRYFHGRSSGEQYWLLYIDLRPGQTCYSKVIYQKEVTHSDCSYGKKSRRRAWLTIWDKLKSQCTVIDGCTGREWPVNCMTVISAWWRSNMPFQWYWVSDLTII